MALIKALRLALPFIIGILLANCTSLARQGYFLRIISFTKTCAVHEKFQRSIVVFKLKQFEMVLNQVFLCRRGHPFRRRTLSWYTTACYHNSSLGKVDYSIGNSIYI